MDHRVLLLAVMLVVAGCSGTVQETQTQTTTSETATETTAEPTTTTEAPPDNPWQQETVTVAIDNQANQSRDVTPLVEETLEYWNTDGALFGTYSINFELESDSTSDADLVVEYVENISTCGTEHDEKSVGCAPVIDSEDSVDSQETLRIEAGYTDNSTVETMKHEFGHVIGIQHGEPPRPLMAAEGPAYELPKPNATERPNPWRNDTVRVYVNSSDLDDNYEQDRLEDDLDHVFTYVNNGAEGTVAENVSVAEVSDRDSADIVVGFPSEYECRGEVSDSGSCGTVYGNDTDGDGALEYYSEGEIDVSTHRETNAWHIGYWLLYALGVEEGEYPPPFVDADYDVRAGDWWE